MSRTLLLLLIFVQTSVPVVNARGGGIMTENDRFIQKQRNKIMKDVNAFLKESIRVDPPPMDTSSFAEISSTASIQGPLRRRKTKQRSSIKLSDFTESYCHSTFSSWKKECTTKKSECSDSVSTFLEISNTQRITPKEKKEDVLDVIDRIMKTMKAANYDINVAHKHATDTLKAGLNERSKGKVAPQGEKKKKKKKKKGRSSGISEKNPSEISEEVLPRGDAKEIDYAAAMHETDAEVEKAADTEEVPDTEIVEEEIGEEADTEIAFTNSHDGDEAEKMKEEEQRISNEAANILQEALGDPIPEPAGLLEEDPAQEIMENSPGAMESTAALFDFPTPPSVENEGGGSLVMSNPLGGVLFGAANFDFPPPSMEEGG